MKHTIWQRTAVLCVGAAFALTAASARADEPKKDDAPTTKPHHKQTAAKVAHAQPQTRTDLAKRNNAAPIPTRDGRNSTYTTGGVVGGANGPERSVLTGSHIPRAYNRRAYSTDSQDNAFIYDKNDIRLQENNNVGDSLRSVPGLTVRTR